jgi:hypothetical protein
MCDPFRVAGILTQEKAGVLKSERSESWRGGKLASYLLPITYGKEDQVVILHSFSVSNVLH